MKQLNLTIAAVLFSFISFALAPITGSNHVCTGSTITLSDATSGGTWSSSNTALASIGSITGVLTGIDSGVVNITYTVSGSYVTHAVSVNPTPSCNVTGGGSYCESGSGAGVHIGISCSSVGVNYQVYNGGAAVGMPFTGTGSPMDFGVHYHGAFSVVGINPITGCNAILHDTVIITALASPSPINGGATVCVGDTIMLSDDSTAGVWSSNLTTIATVGSVSGIVTGVAAGNDTIKYTYPSNGCFVYSVITATACASTGINIPDKTNQINIYPNPATNELIVNFQNNAFNKLTITNSIGQEQISEPVNAGNNNIIINQLPSGLYYIILKGESGTAVRKVMKM